MHMQKITVDCGGFPIEGMLYLPEKDRFPLVIMCHAFNGQMSNFQITASTFAKNGIGALCFNFRGGGLHDKSGFPTTQMTVFTEKDDLTAVLEYAKTLTCVEKIFLFGASQGGIVAAIVAKERSADVSGLVLLYPAFSMADDLRARNPRPEDIPETFGLFGMELGKDYVLSVRDFDTFKEADGFAKPVLIVHGEADPLVPLSYSVRAAKRYENASLVVLEKEKHGFTAQGNARAAQLALEFMQASLS